MPAIYAHYQFGKKVYRQLPQNIKKLVKENKEAYFLGLHGPDLVFYYHPLWKNNVSDTGTKMHEELASVFFEKGRRKYQEHPDHVLLAYLSGFICHYILDSECHPYIANYMEEYEISHSDVETDFDQALMLADGLNPTTHNCTRHLIREPKTEQVISSMHENISVKQIDESIKGFRFCIKILQCKSGKKESILRLIFKWMGESSHMGSMIMTNRIHPKCRESREFLTERLNRAVPAAADLITEYIRMIDTDAELNKRFFRNFED